MLRCVLVFLGIFAYLMGTDFLIHNTVLMADYAPLQGTTFRLEGDMQALGVFFFLYQALMAFAFTWLLCGKTKAVKLGLAFACVALAHSSIAYVTQSITAKIGIVWAIGGFIQYALLGVICSFLPKAGCCGNGSCGDACKCKKDASHKSKSDTCCRNETKVSVSDVGRCPHP